MEKDDLLFDVCGTREDLACRDTVKAAYYSCKLNQDQDVCVHCGSNDNMPSADTIAEEKA